MNNINSFIFDLDGTIFEADKLVLHAFNNTFTQLRSKGYNIESPDEAKILSIIGLVLEDIWGILTPTLPVEVRFLASKLLLENELDGIKNGYGNLYPKVSETLIALKNKGFKLFIASNGLEVYVTFILRHFHILPFFDGVYTAGAYETEKKEDLVRILMLDNNITDGFMIGDRISDVKAGKSNGLSVIGCNYDFASNSELEDADFIIHSFDEIINLTKSAE